MSAPRKKKAPKREGFIQPSTPEELALAAATAVENGYDEEEDPSERTAISKLLESLIPKRTPNPFPENPILRAVCDGLSISRCSRFMCCPGLEEIDRAKLSEMEDKWIGAAAQRILGRLVLDALIGGDATFLRTMKEALKGADRLFHRNLEKALLESFTAFAGNNQGLRGGEFRKAFEKHRGGELTADQWKRLSKVFLVQGKRGAPHKPIK